MRRRVESAGGTQHAAGAVRDLARPGCARYEEGGKCFATAVSLGTVVQGSGDEKKQNAAVEIKCSEIKDRAVQATPGG